MNDHSQRARLFGWISFACCVAAIAAVSQGSHRGPSWIFGAAVALSIAGALVGLAGIEARRSSEASRPSEPVVSFWLALLVSIYALLAWFVAKAPMHM